MTKTEKNNLFYDGFNSRLIETSLFESFMEIPKLDKPSVIRIPNSAVPFSQRTKSKDNDMLVFYEKDPLFRDLISTPQAFINELKKFRFISTPDCSLYRDMPLSFQIANIAVSRSIGRYCQDQGLYVIPNVRWGDERTYTKWQFDIPLAFAGIPKESIVSVGSYGCCKSKEDKYYLIKGMQAMINWLEPETVIVYGAMNPRLFEPFSKQTKLIHIPDWISSKKRGCE